MIIGGCHSVDVSAGVVGGLIVTLVLRLRFELFFMDILQSELFADPTASSNGFAYAPQLFTFLTGVVISSVILGSLNHYRQKNDITSDRVGDGIIILSLAAIPTLVVFGSIIGPVIAVWVKSLTKGLGAVFVATFVMFVYLLIGVLTALLFYIFMLLAAGSGALAVYAVRRLNTHQ